MNNLCRHITELTQDEKKEDISEMICDDIIVKKFTEEDKKLLEQFSKLKLLSFNCCKLSSLDSLPSICSLEELQLSDNFLSGKELSKLLIYPRLTKLKICNNRIDNFDDFKVLDKLKDLNFLDLTENPITQKPNYRNKIFEILPKLVYLDYKNKNGEECPESDEEEDEEDQENDDEKSFIVDDSKEEEEDDNENDEEDEEDEEEEESKGKKKRKTQ